MGTLRAPFPWFGGKSRAAHLIWPRLGDVPNYVEPFFGSGAIMLARPTTPRIETVNDLDCYLANFYRALIAAPREVARWADYPVNEADLHARHLWLVRQRQFTERMKTDPECYDAKIAGWWVWGLCCWTGSGWCMRTAWNGRINAARAERGVHRTAIEDAGWRKRPESGRGVHSQIEEQTAQKRPRISGWSGTGVHRSLELREADERRPHLGRDQGGGKRLEAIEQWFGELSERLRRVRVCCGDWKRVLGRSPTERIGVTGIVLDPPYSDLAERRKNIYAEDDPNVAHEVREWAIENGNNPQLRIVLCGYEGEHMMPRGWSCVAWKANGGHGNSGHGRGRANAERERLWFSPHCLQPEVELFPEPT